jgi:hypothetical protein
MDRRDKACCLLRAQGWHEISAACLRDRWRVQLRHIGKQELAGFARRHSLHLVQRKLVAYAARFSAARSVLIFFRHFVTHGINERAVDYLTRLSAF